MAMPVALVVVAARAGMECDTNGSEMADHLEKVSAVERALGSYGEWKWT
jgi:hypothetical protein